MTTTYVFGAGASLHAGYPLTSNLGEPLLDYMLRCPAQPYQNAAQFLISTFGKSPHIEKVISDLGSCIKDAEARGDKTEHMRLGSQRGFLRDALAKWFQEIHTKPATTYAAFAEKIAKSGDVVITFNYDDSLERELRRTGKWDISRGYGFPLGTVDNSSDVLVLKLHGSINWLVSIFGGAKPGSGWMVSSDPSSLGHHPVIHPDDLDYLGYKNFSGHTYASGGAFACLILPGRTKEFFYDTSGGHEYAQFWDSLWSHAADAVKRSDKIVLCGYSLLPIDQRACDLLLQGPSKETRVLAVCGSQSERIAADFTAAGFRNVASFKGGYFEDWVKSEVQRRG